jgi:SAM-dependent methyltransferase
MNIRERILKVPFVYRSLTLLVSPASLAADTVRDFLDVADGSRVLDLGCGYGEIAKYFVGRTEYVGIDSNQGYIDEANLRFRNTNAQFIVADIADPKVLALGPFDLVLLTGVLHHLPSELVKELAEASKGLVSTKGRFVAVEPVFAPDQRLSARLTIAADRGRYVRDAEGYVSLLKNGFKNVESQVLHGRLRIPYSHVILTCSN